MKHTRIFLSTVLAGCLVLAGCADNKPSDGTPSKTVDEEDKPPFIGMTKQQALKRYGEPRTQTATDEGDSWIYVRGVGAAIAKAAIPFYFGGRNIKTGTLIFDANGKVKKFTWDTHTDD